MIHNFCALKACDSIYLRGRGSDSQNVRSSQLKSVLPKILPFMKFSGSLKRKKLTKKYNLCSSYQIYYSFLSIVLFLYGF